MTVEYGEVDKISASRFEVSVTGDTRHEVISPQTKDELWKIVQAAGMSDPALEPGVGGVRFDEKTGRYTKLYRFLGI